MVETVCLINVPWTETDSLSNTWPTLITKCWQIIDLNCGKSWNDTEVVSGRMHDGTVIVRVSLMINLDVFPFHKLVQGVALHERLEDTNVVVAIWSVVLVPEANSMANQVHHYSTRVAVLSKFDHLLAAIVADQFGATTWIIPTGAGASVLVVMGELEIVRLHRSKEET